MKSELPDLFERRGLDDQHHDGRYFDLIPILILTASSVSNIIITPEIMYEIMALTVYHFEVDDFIEHVLEVSNKQFVQDVDTMLELLLDHQLSLEQIHCDTDSTYSSDDGSDSETLDPKTSDALSKLQKFVEYHIHHPAVLSSPASLQAQLRCDLASFIRAGIRQSEQSKTFFTSGQLPTMSFYDWLYTTSIVNSGGFPWSSVTQALFSQQHPSTSAIDLVSSHLLSEVRTHIALKYRFTNDRTSLYRDRKENNLNCVDFPEFNFPQGDTHNDNKVARVKADLLALEVCEERMCDGLFAELEATRVNRKEEERSEVKAVRFFKAVEVVHGAFYELKSHKQ